MPTILERDIIVKLCSVLGTVDSITIIESNEEKIDDVQSIYRDILKEIPKKTWSDAKIRLIRLMGNKCGLVPNLIKYAIKNNDIITDDNKFDFYFIVIENLSKYDFSEFIICCGWSFCNDYSDFGAILEGYRKTSFAQHFVIEYLQECVYESLLDDIENILENETDAFICTSCEEVAEEMEIFLEEIKDTYPFLKEDEIDSIRENVDLKSIVD